MLSPMAQDYFGYATDLPFIDSVNVISLMFPPLLRGFEVLSAEQNLKKTQVAVSVILRPRENSFAFVSNLFWPAVLYGINETLRGAQFQL